MLCECCGNDFYNGKLIKKDDQDYVVCPYCGCHNKRMYIKKNKKRGIRK